MEKNLAEIADDIATLRGHLRVASLAAEHLQRLRHGLDLVDGLNGLAKALAHLAYLQGDTIERLDQLAKAEAP